MMLYGKGKGEERRKEIKRDDTKKGKKEKIYENEARLRG